MKLHVTNLDEELSVRVFTRSTKTGGDGQGIDLKPGETADVEISDEDHLVAAPIGFAKAAQGVIVRAPSKVDTETKGEADDTETVQLVDADDAQVTAILTEMRDAGQNLTAKGLPELPEVNRRLASGGFNGIDAARRDTLFASLRPAT